MKVFLGNDVFVNLRTVPVSENLYLFLAIVADIVHSKPKHTWLIYIARFVLSLKVFYKTFRERLSCMMFCDAGPALILTVCKQ